MIRGVYHHTSTSIKHVMRCRIPSTTSNDAAAAISCIWDTVLSSEGQDTGRPRTYIRSGVVLRHKAYELEDGLLGRDGREERGRWRRCKVNVLYTRPSANDTITCVLSFCPSTSSIAAFFFLHRLCKESQASLCINGDLDFIHYLSTFSSPLKTETVGHERQKGRRRSVPSTASDNQKRQICR